MNVLYIDGDLDSIEHMEALLVESGFTLYTATDARNGYALTQDIQPLVIVLSMELPVINGLQALVNFKQRRHLRDTPVIGVSFSDDDDLRHAFFEHGGSGFLLKPLNRERLMDMLQSVIAQAVTR